MTQHTVFAPNGRGPRLAALTALAAAVAVSLTGCFASAAPGDTAAPTPVASMAQPMPTGDGTLTIGVVVAFGGADAALGAASLAGAELAARDIDEAGGVGGKPLVVVPGDGTAGKAAASVSALAAKAVDALVGPNSEAAQSEVDSAAVAAGIPVVTAVGEAEAVDEAFTARLRSSDPTLAGTAFGAESYDAVVMIALAAKLAGDDGRASIAQFLPAVTSGTAQCSSYGACLDAITARVPIRYTGVTGQLSTAAGSTSAGTLALAGLAP